MTPTPDVGGRLVAALRRAVPALIGAVVVLALGLVAVRVGAANLDSAERLRLESRVGMIDGLRENAAADVDPSASVPLVEGSGFTPGDHAGNGDRLRQFAASTPGRIVALLDADGRTTTAIPSTTEIDVADLGDAWSVALSGEPTVSDTFELDGSPVAAHLVPVGDEPWGVVVLAQPSLGSPSQTFLEQVGSLNEAPGGLLVVDRTGVAYLAWSLELSGEPVVDPAEVAALEPGRVTSWTSSVDGTERTRVGAPLAHGYALVFDQASNDLFGDLRDAQRSRTLVLFGVLGASVVALVVFQWRREGSARAAEDRVHALLRSSHDLVVVVGPHGRLDYVSPSVEGLLGRDADDLVDRPLVDLVVPADRERLLAVAAGPGDRPVLNVRLPTASGGTEWFDVEARDLRSHRAVRGVLLTFHLVGERKQLEDELVHQATHDRLTGLPNRHTLLDEVGSRLTGPLSGRFGLLYIDLDHFKPVNDVHGHDAGDRVLVTVAERLRRLVDSRGVVARLGGDEFIVVLDDVDPDAARAVGDAVLHAVRTPIVIGTALAHIDASVGIVVASPGVEVTPDQLIRQADEAMYEAKAAGRGRAVLAAGAAPQAAAVDVAVVVPVASTVPPPRRAPAPVAARSGHRHPWLPRLRSWGPLLLAAAIVVGIGAIGQQQSLDRQRDAEHERLAHNLDFTAWSAEYYSEQYEIEPLVDLASTSPWTLDGGSIDAAVVEAFATSSAVGEGAVAVLTRPSGEPIVAHPAGHRVRIDPADPVWQAAAAGTGNQVPVVEDDDDVRSYFLLPIRRGGQVEAVLALGVSTTQGPGQVALAQGGVEGIDSGGWSLLDDDGRIYMSWDNGLVGTSVADPATLAELEPGEAVDLSDDETVLLVSPMSSTYEPTFLAYLIPADDLYADLRVGAGARDLSFVAVVAAAVVGLAWVNHRRERAVRRSQERLDAFVQNAHDLLVVLGPDRRIRFLSSAVQHLLGYPVDHRPEGTVLDLVHPGDRERALALIATTDTRGSASASDVRLRAADGEWRWFDVHASDHRHRREVGGILLTCHDVTERRALQEQLAVRALHDPLTGLPNRVMLSRALSSLVEEDAGQFAVLFVDLDHFKPVNDTLGHDAGDVVLREIAARFDRNVRRDEAGRERDLVCRLGGDEFAILLRDVDEATARETADRLIGVASRPVQVGDRTVRVGATIGVALSHPSGGDPTRAISDADAAMYRAKAGSRGTYEVATTPTS